MTIEWPQSWNDVAKLVDKAKRLERENADLRRRLEATEAPEPRQKHDETAPESTITGKTTQGSA